MSGAAGAAGRRGWDLFQRDGVDNGGNGAAIAKITESSVVVWRPSGHQMSVMMQYVPEVVSTAVAT